MDKNGEEARQAIVTSISNVPTRRPFSCHVAPLDGHLRNQSYPAVITTHEEKPHDLGEGDYVDFTEVCLL